MISFRPYGCTFRSLALTGTAIMMAASLSACGFFESGAQTQHAALEKQNTGFERISLYDAVAISLQRNHDAPLIQDGSTAVAEAPLLQAWEKIDLSLTGLNPGHSTRNKTAEQIIADTRSTYLRAVAANYLDTSVTQGLSRLQAALNNPGIDPEERIDRENQIAELRAAYAPFAAAKQNLAALLGVNNANALVLDDLPPPPLTAQDDERLDSLERNALANRAEFDIIGVPSTEEIEALLTRAEGLLPQAAPEAQWLAFTDQFGDGLSRILAMTLPLQDPQTQERFAQLRAEAVSTAIVAQVRLAHAQMHIAQQDAARTMNETASETLVGTLRADIAKHQAMIALYDAQDLLKRSIGVAPIPVNAERMKLADLSGMLQNRDHRGPENTLISLQDTLYQSPELTPAAFHPVDFLGKIPLPQKIAVFEGAETSIFHRFTLNPRTLNVSARRVKALLDAPVIEP